MRSLTKEEKRDGFKCHGCVSQIQFRGSNTYVVGWRKSFQAILLWKGIKRFPCEITYTRVRWVPPIRLLPTWLPIQPFKYWRRPLSVDCTAFSHIFAKKIKHHAWINIIYKNFFTNPPKFYRPFCPQHLYSTFPKYDLLRLQLTV